MIQIYSNILNKYDIRNLDLKLGGISPVLVFLFAFVFFNLDLFANTFSIDSTSTYRERPKVGLVFSGGGAKGFAHVGVLKALNEAGVEVDYISGTSMGSIVGGLYAIGYSPQYIEDLIRRMPWTDILLDKIDRRDLSLDEKSYNEQQFMNFPVSKKSVSLPFGMKYGQQISLLLSKLVSPVYHIHNFADFQTPFLCIATDIGNGESVILEKGDLAKSMRASMAIPTAFTPITIDGRLLVDGGLVNNFPAKELAERGCDIIIGVDVQTNKDYQISDLSSITAILDRSAGFYRKALNDTAKNYVDFYIHPDISGYGVGSFSSYDSLLARGHKTGQAYKEVFEELAAYLQTFPDYKTKTRDLEPLKSFVLDTVVIIGNKEVSERNIRSALLFEKGDVVEMDDLQKTIDLIYGSLFFNSVKYSLVQGRNGVKIVINVEEASFGSIGIGVHYDTDYSAGLLISSKFRNVFINNTLLDFNLGLSENPHVSLKYYQNNGLKPSFGFSSNWVSFSFIEYKNGKDKVAQYRFNNLVTSLYVQLQSKKTVAFGGGVQLEFSTLRNDIGVDFGVDDSDFSQSNFNFFGYVKVDRWDKSFFPHRGGKLDIKAILVTEFLTGGNMNFGEKLTVISGEYDKAVPIAPKWTFRPRINMGFSFGQGSYYSQMFLLGGQGNNYLHGMVEFTGLNVAQLTGRQMLAGRLGFQYNILKKHYLLATLDMGNVGYAIDEVFEFKHAAAGYGITYGYDSFIGPLELSVMGSNYRGISAFLNLGFWF
ncbi:MAG: patatin-like phospholipase family protein [Bacteroidales bacterium]|nr:patatin-like phospholipase family protein [Bacteroidales bacterium]